MDHQSEIINAVGRPPANTEQIITLYAEIARPMILEWFTPNCCVAATRITIEVLNHFNIPAVAVPMSFVVQAKDIHLAWVIGLSADQKTDVVQKAATFIDLNHHNEDSWNGHLVAVADGPDKRYLIDASFDQASLPDQGMPIEPHILVAPAPLTIAPNDIGADMSLDSNGQTIDVRYTPIDDYSFTSAPAWETDHLQVPIILICRKILAELRV